MLICERCKQRIASNQPDLGKSFPAFTVLAGLLGTAGAAVTGALIAVPASLVLGALTDASDLRCGMCDNEIEPEERPFALMEDLGDDVSGRSFRPVKNAAPLQAKSAQPTPVDRSPHSRAAAGHGGQPEADLPNATHDAEDTFVGIFKEHGGKLVPVDPPPVFQPDDLDAPRNPVTPAAPDGNQPLERGGGPLDLAQDDFTVLDDPATHIDDQEGLEWPPLGGCPHE